MTASEPNAAAAEDAICKIGAEFQRLRSLRGERLEDVADYLDIKAIYLYGVEQGDLSVIPDRLQARAILRSYADYLGLEGERIAGPLGPIIMSLKGDRAPAQSEEAGWLDRTSAIIGAGAILLGALAGWSYIGDANQFDLLAPPIEAEVVDHPEDAAAMADDAAGRAVETAAVDGGQGNAEPSEKASAAEEAGAALADLKAAVAEQTNGAGAEAGVAVRKEEQPANVLAALVAERGDGAHIYEADNTDARVIVRALDEVSVQVTSRGRDYVWTRKMKPREMLLVPNRDDLDLWTGDAAAIELLLDGVVLPPLGPPDTVISGLSLAASSLEALAAETLSDNGAKPTF
jgi:cytoskeleton protein RodZ